MAEPLLPLIRVACLLAIAGTAQIAQACSCSVGSAAEKFADAPRVVTGEITRVDREPMSGLQHVDLRVLRTWKGLSEPVLQIDLHSQSGACGFTVEPGARVAWLLYRGRDEPHFGTSYCSVPVDSKERQIVDRMDGVAAP
jgi:hypothetical protein